MAGRVPAIHAFAIHERKAWMPGTSPGMTNLEDAGVDKLKDLIKGPDLIVAPVALNPIMAQMAELAGFKAAYLSGGSLGWYKGVTEAGLSLSEMIQVVVDIRTVCRVPVVLDAGAGFGDPVHVHRTVTMS